jgi:hypothetical protein
MYKLSRFYLLLSHNPTIFVVVVVVVVEGMYYTLYLSFSDLDDFYTRDIARKLIFYKQDIIFFLYLMYI